MNIGPPNLKWAWSLCCVVVGLALCFFGGISWSAQSPDAESRALAFLSMEVPRWSTENECYSCHNNGDAARALYTGLRMGFRVPREALLDTTAWLAKPQQWDHNGGEGPFSDKRLARIQFAAALRLAVQLELVKDSRAIAQAADQLAADQEADGSWPSDTAETIGSPATYGTPLATFMARETLRSADAKKYAAGIERATNWLRRVSVHNMVDAAAVLMAGELSEQPESVAQRQRALELIRKGQSKEGGWGPYVTAPPEPFDTALVILALVPFKNQAEVAAMVARGRTYLIANQLDDGSWPETTRPPGAQSYAQRLSTTGWATMALLATRSPRR